MAYNTFVHICMFDIVKEIMSLLGDSLFILHSAHLVSDHNSYLNH